jgi:hypothetical protein
MAENTNTTSRAEVFRREAERNAASAVTHFRFPSKPFPHSILLVFKEYDFSNFKNEQYGKQLSSAVDGTGRLVGADKSDASVSLRTERSVELPFPKQLSETISPIINNMQRDPMIEDFAGSVNNFLQGNSSTLSSIPGAIQKLGAGAAAALSGASGKGLGNQINELAGQIGGVNTSQALVLASYLGRSVINALPGDIARNVNTATGNLINPRETLAFEGVQLRSHSFTWDLYPSNVDDSKRIQEIISIMKRSILPRTQDISFGSGDSEYRIGKAFLKYPHVLEMYLIGVRDGYFVKYKPCFVTNMTVDYGAGGSVAMLKGGRPAGVTISLTMQELQIETAHDYGEEALDDKTGSMMAETAPETTSDPGAASSQYRAGGQE